ncbi:MAG: hypothetical protein KA257_06465 [Opitutaceae bacterium]|nr:hypothetical protein [Opitutaceae bacterium]MBP9912527.1 hypothetical protein [Opitutaceae bacterium]
MNNDEAKFILRAYRPGGRDAGDATFAAVLEQARRDPALGAWFAREQAHDTAVAAKVRELAPPAGLREAILAGGRVSAAPKRRWRQPAWLALAASVAVVLGVLATWPDSRAEAAPVQLAEFALNDMVHGTHGGHGEASSTLHRWLSAKDNRIAGALPINFDQLRRTGCRTLSYDGREMLEMCFARNGTMFHLYVVREKAAKTGGEAAEPMLLAQAGGAAAVWSDGRFQYALVGPGATAELQRLI